MRSARIRERGLFIVLDRSAQYDAEKAIDSSLGALLAGGGDRRQARRVNSQLLASDLRRVESNRIVTKLYFVAKLERSQCMRKQMKLHIKFAFIVCCAATYLAAEFEGRYHPSPGGSRRAKIHPAECHHSRGRHSPMDLGRQRHTVRPPGRRGIPMGYGIRAFKISDLSLATPSPRRGPSPTSARSTWRLLRHDRVGHCHGHRYGADHPCAVYDRRAASSPFRRPIQTIQRR